MSDCIRSNVRGFTLLEVIVVLIITSIVTAILMQVLSLALNTRFRISDELVRLETVNLERSVITSPLTGAIPDFDGGASEFVGERRRLKGLTLSPLQGGLGAPTAFSMTLEYNAQENVTELTYLEWGYSPVLLSQWPGDSGTFTYRGRSGDWRDTWPPPLSLLNPNEIYKQTPRTIRLDRGPEVSGFVVRVMAPHDRIGPVQTGPFGSTQ